MPINPIAAWQVRRAQSKFLAGRLPEEKFVEVLSRKYFAYLKCGKPGKASKLLDMATTRKDAIEEQKLQLGQVRRGFYCEAGFPLHEMQAAKKVYSKYFFAGIGCVALTCMAFLSKLSRGTWADYYLSDVIFPMVGSVVIAACLSAGKLNEILKQAWKDAKYALSAGGAFVFASIMEIDQSYGSPIFGFLKKENNFDPNDFIAYGAGAIIAFIALKYNSAIARFFLGKNGQHQ